MKQLALWLSLSLCALGAQACSGSVGSGGSGGGDEGGSGGDGGDGGDAGNAGGRGGGSGGSGGTGGVTACNGTAAVTAGRWRRLTVSQYRSSVRDLLGVDPDTSGFLLDTNTGPFATNAQLPPQDTDVAKYQSAAEGVASKAIADVPKLIGCDTAAMGEDACATKFITDFVTRAFRRPITDVEKTAFQKVYTTGKMESFAVGIRLVVEAALQSPSFLYLVEVGSGAGAAPKKLSGYEVASRLSYTLTGTMPDASLFAAAKNGELDAPEGIRTQAMRLINSDKFVATASSFHTQLLEVTPLSRDGVVTKDAAKFPEFDAAMKTAMLEEPRRFVENVFTKGGGSIEELLSAPMVFPTGPLTKLYGLSSVPADGKVTVTDGSRAGLLTTAGVLATHPAVPTHYGAVIRGHMVRRNFFCAPVPPPAQAVEFKPPPNADQLSQQELLRAHQENPSCKQCHKLMDPIGFGFEGFDLIGRYRTKTAEGQTIDTSGEIVETDAAGTFANVKELTDKLAKSKDVRACLGEQWFRFTLARTPGDDDACSREVFEKALVEGKGDVRSGLLSLVTSDAFRYRRGE